MQLLDLKPTSRVWIYQADRQLTIDEVDEIERAGKLFVENWTAHGSNLEAGIEVKYDCFVVVAVDEAIANATGCSIDKSVHFMQDLGKQLSVDFFNRLNIAVQVENGIKLLSLQELGTMVSEGIIEGSTLTFNNTITTVEELGSNWRIPLSSSWAWRHVLVE